MHPQISLEHALGLSSHNRATEVRASRDVEGKEEESVRDRDGNIGGECVDRIAEGCYISSRSISY